MTALAGVQQEQSTLQNTETWNTTVKFQKNSCSKRTSGVSDESKFIQIIKGSSSLMVLKLTKNSCFTNISSESNFQLKKGSKFFSFVYLYKK